MENVYNNRNLNPSNFESIVSVNFSFSVTQGGTDTWPIVAMTYIYVKKDLTYISDPASQSLLKAFLRAVYSDEYIPQCEEEFGFVRVGGALRDQALAAIDSLVTSPIAPEWTFETDTQKRTGQGDYVISQKRKSYSELEQDKLVEMIGKLDAKVMALEFQNAQLVAAVEANGKVTINPPPASASTASSVDTAAYVNNDSSFQTNAAYIMGIVSCSLWGAFILYSLFSLITRADSKDTAPKSAVLESGDVA